MGRVSRADVDAHVGRRIADCRRARNLTQTEMGRMLGVSFQQVQKYENGINRVAAGSLYVLATAMKTVGGVNFFFEGLPDVAALNPANYAPEEHSLLELFRALPSENQQLVLNLARSLAGVSGPLGPVVETDVEGEQ